MEVSVTNDFRPFSITIKFETIEEARRWADMLSFNLTIPEQVMNLRDGVRDTMTREMSKVQEKILDQL